MTYRGINVAGLTVAILLMGVVVCVADPIPGESKRSVPEGSAMHDPAHDKKPVSEAAKPQRQPSHALESAQEDAQQRTKSDVRQKEMETRQETTILPQLNQPR